MATHVALLRGINNVGSRRVPMADLRQLFEKLGFRGVRTLRNSGNVVFSSTDRQRGGAPARIEKAIGDRFGFPPFVSVLSGEEVTAVVRDNPLSGVAKNPSHLLVAVARESSDVARLKPLLKERWGREALALGKRVAYLWCADGVAESALWPAADRALERECTARNIATMTKLAAIVEAAAS